MSNTPEIKRLPCGQGSNQCFIKVDGVLVLDANGQPRRFEWTDKYPPAPEKAKAKEAV